MHTAKPYFISGKEPSVEVAWEFDKDDLEAVRDTQNDPHHRNLIGSMSRVDVTNMLLQRRQFHAWRATDGISGITLFADSSPITGEELFGMIMEVLDRSPGCSQPHVLASFRAVL